MELNGIKPIKNSEGMAKKRLTQVEKSPLKYVLYYSITVEQSMFGIGEDAIGSVDFFSFQKLCHNKKTDEINWHCFVPTADLDFGEYFSLESVGKKWNLKGIKATTVPRYPRIDWILNPVVFIESDTSRRVFLYVDSIVNSWEEA